MPLLTKFSILLLLCASLLAACAGPPAQGTPLPTEIIATPGGPPTDTPPSASPSPPEPTHTETPPPQETLVPTSEFAPQPGDRDFERGSIFIEDGGVRVLEGDPAQVLLSLSGNRPTPCHQLRVTVGEPDGRGQVPVEVYTVRDPALVCIQVLRPFSAEVPLGVFAPGSYTVVVNDELIFEFTV
jgi:hypothetical protein